MQRRNLVVSAVVCLASLTTPCRAQEKDKETVIAAIRKHFEKAPPQSRRYAGGVTFYGETRTSTAIGADGLRVERELFATAREAGLLQTMPEEVRWLGHDLLVHDPDGCAAFLQALVAAAVGTRDRKLFNDMANAILAGGEAGERALVAVLDDADLERRRTAAKFLARIAIYRSSAAPIEAKLGSEADPEVCAGLWYALALIGLPQSAPLARERAKAAKDDAEQKAAIYAVVELDGFDALAWLKDLTPVGPTAKQECDEAKQFLEAETSATNKHGREVSSDSEFVGRFGDLVSCPTIRWLADEKLLSETAVQQPAKLSDEQKARLLELLEESRGFGVEAVKGALFLSLAKDDEPALLRIRAASFHSPNTFSQGRLHTLSLMVRHLRQQP